MNQITRHQFIKTLTWFLSSTGLVAIAAPLITYLYPSHLEETPAQPVFVANEADLAASDSRTVLYGRYPAIVVNTTQGLKGYSAVCTHFACIVKWNRQIDQFACPCHAGFYDSLDGHVISGPPPRPIASIPVHIEGGEIFLGDAVGS